MKNNFEIIRYRRKLRNFFNNVNASSDDLRWKEKILDWIVELYKYKDITVESFEYLFSKYTGVTFPIQYDSTSCSGLIDSLGNKFYFFTPFLYGADYNTYTIGKRDSAFDISLDFKILQDNKIVVTCMYILPLNEDNSNKDYMVAFEYNYNFTNVILKKANKEVLCLSYPKQNQDFDANLADYLFALIDSNFYDVLPIFSTMVNLIENIEHLHVKSFDEKGDTLSEILSTNGVVTKYLFTIKNSSSLSCLYKLNCSSYINDFISKANQNC